MMTLPALLILSLWKLATSWGKDWLWFGEAVVRRLIALLSRSNCRIRSHHHLSEGKHLRWSFYSSPRVERLKGSGWNPCFCRFLSPWFLQSSAAIGENRFGDIIVLSFELNCDISLHHSEHSLNISKPTWRISFSTSSLYFPWSCVTSRSLSRTSSLSFSTNS